MYTHPNLAQLLMGLLVSIALLTGCRNGKSPTPTSQSTQSPSSSKADASSSRKEASRAAAPKEPSKAEENVNQEALNQSDQVQRDAAHAASAALNVMGMGEVPRRPDGRLNFVNQWRWPDIRADFIDSDNAIEKVSKCIEQILEALKKAEEAQAKANTSQTRANTARVQTILATANVIKAAAQSKSAMFRAEFAVQSRSHNAAEKVEAAKLATQQMLEAAQVAVEKEKA